MSSAVFVIGPPGVGKTTAIRPMLDEGSTLIDKPKWTVGPHVVAPGHYTGKTFDGADFFAERVDRVTAILLTAPADELARRRAKRGTDQNTTWVRGRETKAARFFKSFPEEHRIAFDVTQAKPEALVYFMFCFAMEIEP